MAGVMMLAMLGLAQAATVTPPPAQAIVPSDTAALVMRYRDLTAVTPALGRGCDSPTSSDILVCGSRSSDQRLPLPDERGPPIGPTLEPAGAEANCLAASGRSCAVCPPTGCTGVNVLAIPFKLFRIVQAIVDPEH